MEASTSTLCNRHHLLYPRRLWFRIGPTAWEVRNSFTVIIDKKLHNDLHRDIDWKLGRDITLAMLPEEDVFDRILCDYKSQRGIIRNMEVIGRLEWLKSQFEPNDKRSSWLLDLLDKQEGYFADHREEI